MKTEALKRIEDDFEDFRHAVAQCESATKVQPRALKEAYASYGRVRERYLKEKRAMALAPSEQRALAKVFEDDSFAEGMMVFRQIGEHVVKRTPPVTIRTVDNAPIDLDCETSAVPAFAALEVTLDDAHGAPRRIDHLQLLREAERRIKRALQNAGAFVAGK